MTIGADYGGVSLGSPSWVPLAEFRRGRIAAIVGVIAAAASSAADATPGPNADRRGGGDARRPGTAEPSR